MKGASPFIAGTSLLKLGIAGVDFNEIDALFDFDADTLARCLVFT
jgi:hypothetical protein